MKPQIAAELATTPPFEERLRQLWAAVHAAQKEEQAAHEAYLVAQTKRRRTRGHLEAFLADFCEPRPLFDGVME